jgi:hypothetical protein
LEPPANPERFIGEEKRFQLCFADGVQTGQGVGYHSLGHIGAFWITPERHFHADASRDYLSKKGRQPQPQQRSELQRSNPPIE